MSAWVLVSDRETIYYTLFPRRWSLN